MSEKFRCEHGSEVRPEEDFTLDQCRKCWLAKTKRANDGKVAAAGPGTVRSLPCFHLDADQVIDRRGRTCKGCWIVGCELFKECTTGEEIHATANCGKCHFYQASGQEFKEDRKALVLNNWLCPGDVLVMGAAIDSLHAAYPGEYIVSVRGTDAEEIFRNHPGIRELNPWEWKLAKIIEMQYPLIHYSNQRPVHFMQGYCDFLAEQIGRPIPLSVNRPSVHFSETERSWLSQVEEIDPDFGPFWILNAGTKLDYTAKGWGFANFQELVDSLEGQVRFVQVGRSDHDHKPIRGALDLIGKTTTRQLMRLCSHAAGGIGPTTFVQHLFAAMEKPYVCIVGGREPLSWLNYPTQRTMANAASMSCNGGKACWAGRVVPLKDDKDQDHQFCQRTTNKGGETIPACMAMISVESVRRAILDYYDGGILKVKNERLVP